MKHENIIELVDVFGHVSSVSIVMDFMDTDLEVILGTSRWNSHFLWPGDHQRPESGSHPGKYKIVHSSNSPWAGIPSPALDSSQVQ